MPIILYAVCAGRLPDMSCTNDTRLISYSNGTCYNGSDLVGVWNETVFEDVTHLQRTSASEEYYKCVREILTLLKLVVIKIGGVVTTASLPGIDRGRGSLGVVKTASR